MTDMLRRPVGTFTVAAALAVLAGQAVAQPVVIREFGAGRAPAGITWTAPPRCNGLIWFTEYAAGTHGKIRNATGGGPDEEFPIPTHAAGGAPLGITCGPSPAAVGEDALWFALQNGIGALTLFEQFFMFTVPTANSRPWDIAVDREGNLWFTESAANKIGKVTRTGIVAEYPIPTANSEPYGIIFSDWDGLLWFTEHGASQIASIDPKTGSITEYRIPTANSAPWGIAEDRTPAHRLWVTEEATNKIGRFDRTTKRWGEYPIAGTDTRPQGITAGPPGDTRVWFVQSLGNAIGRITTGGAWELPVPIPTTGSTPRAITSVPGYLWFTEFEVNQIGRVDLELLPPPEPTCGGDCDGDVEVTTAELLTMVAVDLGTEGLDSCEIGAGNDSRITVDDILTAINNAADQCGANTAAQACRDDEGTFGMLTCCVSAPDFPDLCGIGACGCPPDASVPTWVCDCGAGRCFNGEHCVAPPTGPAAQACRDDGGTVSVRSCCASAADFPNLCLPGACGCGPDASAPTWVCDCGAGRCFDGAACVGAPG